MAFAKDSCRSIPTYDSSPALLRIGSGPYDIYIIRIFTSPAEGFDLNLSILLPLDGLNMSVNVSVATAEKIADFKSGLVLGHKFSTPHYLIWLASEPFVTAHPTDIAKQDCLHVAAPIWL
ncbi:hypothetical protein BDS110ZK4_70090 [Bradyrhizobium diazoefficiens]|uniref:Uncharacterized protein n=1 Tax=Bradyrhizobium diazoefficiens TaxID=1355477 RepID=A0A810CMR0_9BRAD|nr:hypothetical protein XF1B_13760 [Bradyrhizobium diazoefficiens]BCE44947.1 hypothetical protein XF4B_12960 [Bradyrhizobium diazoefficiens]BCE88491.1 hypothetical protein XF10B_12890 [Bradyrhizobium diazoefficiens]BCF23423.1 hypothetical protein XF14B_13750 [Bradyrhizobium diazoefficiens]